MPEKRRRRSFTCTNLNMQASKQEAGKQHKHRACEVTFTLDVITPTVLYGTILDFPVGRTDLSQSALQFSQEVSILQTAGFTIDVVDLETQLLHHLKVVVDDKGLGKLGVEAVHDFFCPADLKDARFIARNFFKNILKFTSVQRNIRFHRCEEHVQNLKSGEEHPV